MHCTLLVPDLFWPHDAAGDASRGIAAKTLETLLARARVGRHPAVVREGWLCQAFEVERQQDWPVAPLTLTLDGGDVEDAYWLRADPVHLQLQRERVALIGSDTLELAQDDADALVAALNAQFAADGLRFEARAPQRWYVRAQRPPALETQPISIAAGRDVHDMLPGGPDAPRWRQLINEAQMVLHAHAVNDARAQAGLPAVNSVWLWGGGAHVHVPGRQFSAVWSDDALALALGAHADAYAVRAPADAPAWLRAARALEGDQRHLVTFEECAKAAAYGDVAGWREAVARLESLWIAPLVSALRSGAIGGLALAAPCAAASWHFEASAGRFARFWLRRRPLSAYSGS